MEDDFVCPAVPFARELRAGDDFRSRLIGDVRRFQVCKVVFVGKSVEKLRVAFREAAKPSFLEAIGYSSPQCLHAKAFDLEAIELLEILAQVGEFELFNLREKILQERVI